MPRRERSTYHEAGTRLTLGRSLNATESPPVQRVRGAPKR